jgi:hypothetical protein
VLNRGLAPRYSENYHVVTCYRFPITKPVRVQKIRAKKNPNKHKPVRVQKTWAKKNPVKPKPYGVHTTGFTSE